MKYLGIVVSLLLLTSCAAKTKEQSVGELTICGNGVCSPAQKMYSKDALFSDIVALVKANEGVEIPICVASPQSRECKKEKVCYTVIGGLIPGSGCAKKLTFTNVALQADSAISMETTMPLSFIGTKVSCAAAASRIEVSSLNEVTLTLESYHCSWMVMGQMKAKFHFKVESIDTQKGVLAGYWEHGVSGTGNGRGAGYALLSFKNNIHWSEFSVSSL